MQFLHLADLHLGKRLKEFSLIEDQRFVLRQAVDLISHEKLDGVFISGDVFDSSIPSAEATILFDDFLTSVHELHVPVFLISGNHDSAEKLQFGGRIFAKNQIYVTTDVKNAVQPISIGDINIYLLPFSKPIDVNYAFGTSCKTYTEAISETIKRMHVDPDKANLLLAHQMVLPTNAPLLAGGSESALNIQDGRIIGDVSAISADLFVPFDYVALGHVHRPQTIGNNIRYSGSILKYHKDEASVEKMFTIINVIGKKVTIETKKVLYSHDVRVIKGTFDDIMHQPADDSSYVFAVLTDTSTLDNPMGKLRTRFPYIASVEYENLIGETLSMERVDFEHKSKEELFSVFFTSQNQRPMDKDQSNLIHALLEKEKI